MIIGDFHVQHILKAYSQQLSVRSRISKDRVNKQDGQKDEVTLSKESKKMLVVDKIAKELIAQLTNGSQRNETSQAILKRLSQEYGRPLDVASDGGQGIAFKVLGETDGGVKEYLAPAENNQLEKRLYEMTKSFVNEQLI
ncbi:MAG: hypothetical protein QME83_02710 [Thermodesulfobacteriota bacterium]|nr:hypothetical protein [Thermodesulfobacteriota bacterium]